MINAAFEIITSHGKTVTLPFIGSLTGQAVFNSGPVPIEVEIRKKIYTMFDNKTNKKVAEWSEEQIV